MKVTRLNDLKEYQAAKHFKMSAMRLQGKEETGIQKFWVGLSHFLTGRRSRIRRLRDRESLYRIKRTGDRENGEGRADAQSPRLRLPGSERGAIGDQPGESSRKHACHHQLS